MHSIKKARKLIAKKPSDPNAQILARLVLSLESDAPFALKDLYETDFDTFQLALAVLEDWRLDRYYAGKARLFDVSSHVSALPASTKD